MSAVYFSQDPDGRGTAFWRASDDAPDAFLCGVALDAYDSDSGVRDRFAELVNVAADHCRREHAAQVVAPASRLEGIPCATCAAPEAADIRFRAGQISDASELGLSAGGFPVGCCKRQIVGVIGGRPDTAHARR